jgi:hypothetical protein
LAPQRVLDRREQFCRGHRLEEETHEQWLEVARRGLGRHRDYRNMPERGSALEGARRVDAAHLRHVHVYDDEIRT